MTKVGTVLSGSTVLRAEADLTKDYEARAKVGEYVIIRDKDTNEQLLARIAELNPHHEFYKRGDAYAASRREGYSIPAGLGMQYVSCVLDILGKLETVAGSVKLVRARKSPTPGSDVELADENTLKNVFSASDSDGSYIKFAKLLYYPNVKIALRLSRVTEHIAIFGKTGSGKSFDAGALIEALQNIEVEGKKYRYPVLVIDHHGDYVNIPLARGFKGEVYSYSPEPRSYKVKVGKDEIKEVKHTQLKIDLSMLNASDVAELIVKFYAGTITESESRQIEGFRRALEKWGQQRFNSITDPGFEDIIKDLTTKDEIHRSTAEAMKRALSRFKSKVGPIIGPYPYDEWLDNITGKHTGVHVIDHSPEGSPDIDIELKQLILGYLCQIIFNWFTKNPGRYLLIVVEEAQNYAPRVTEYKVGKPALSADGLSVLATQGRKFGASLCLITQRPGFLDRAIISQCNTFLIKRISPEDKSYVLTAIGGLPKDYEERLTILDREELIIAGTMLKHDFPIIAQIDATDRTVPHAIEEKDPVEVFKTLQP